MTDETRKKIAQEFGFQALPPPEQERVVEKIGNMLFVSTLERSFSQLNQTDLDEYGKMLADPGASQDKIMEFLNKHVSGLGGIVSEELTKLKQSKAYITV